MMTVTKIAKQVLKEKLQDHCDDPKVCLRLTSKSQGQFGLVFSKEESSDQVVMHEERKVLLIGKELLNEVDELTLDAEETPTGMELGIYGNEYKR
jgi:hypothetical protein